MYVSMHVRACHELTRRRSLHIAGNLSLSVGDDTKHSAA